MPLMSERFAPGTFHIIPEGSTAEQEVERLMSQGYGMRRNEVEEIEGDRETLGARKMGRLEELKQVIECNNNNLAHLVSDITDTLYRLMGPVVYADKRAENSEVEDMPDGVTNQINDLLQLQAVMLSELNKKTRLLETL